MILRVIIIKEVSSSIQIVPVYIHMIAINNPSMMVGGMQRVGVMIGKKGSSLLLLNLISMEEMRGIRETILVTCRHSTETKERNHPTHVFFLQALIKGIRISTQTGKSLFLATSRQRVIILAGILAVKPPTIETITIRAITMYTINMTWTGCAVDQRMTAIVSRESTTMEIMTLEERPLIDSRVTGQMMHIEGEML